MVEAATILRAAGYHAAPVPLAETMLGRWVCAACGIETPAGALTIGPVEPGGRLAPLPDAIDLRLVQRFGALFRAARWRARCKLRLPCRPAIPTTASSSAGRSPHSRR